jgi:hypothetical protein
MDISTARQERTIRALLLENIRRLPQADIAYIGWLSRNKVTKKTQTSVLVEFLHSEDANIAIDHGLL